MTSIRLAPMAGITDWPFRVLCFEQGCDVATTEMVSAMGYLYAPRNHPATVSLIERRDSEGKLLVQISAKRLTSWRARRKNCLPWGASTAWT